jgi:hypothetical protein
MNLPIVNQGDNPACQFHIKCCYASAETPSDIHIVTDQIICDPIFKGQPFSLPFTTVAEHYRSFGNGTTDVVGGMLPIYCSLQYSDASSGGVLCGNEWYLMYDWVAGELIHASLPISEEFEPFVRALLGNATVCE